MGLGVYQCFCQKQFTYYSLVKRHGIEQLCSSYDTAYSNSLLLQTAISVSITISDVVLRTINMVLIKKIGFRTLSQETREIMTLTFLSQFFNFAILFLVSTADLHFLLPFLDPNYQGFPSIGAKWFKHSSPILVQSLLINLFTPQIDFVLSFLKKWFERKNDRGCRGRGSTKTRKI